MDSPDHGAEMLLVNWLSEQGITLNMEIQYSCMTHHYICYGLHYQLEEQTLIETSEDVKSGGNLNAMTIIKMSSNKYTTLFILITMTDLSPLNTLLCQTNNILEKVSTPDKWTILNLQKSLDTNYYSHTE